MLHRTLPKAATVSGDFSYVRVVPEVSSVGVTASEVSAR